MILHTVNKSPFRHDALASCLRLIADGDVLLLIENGVYAVLPAHPLAEELRQCGKRNIALYALSADILARGLQDRLPNHIYPCGDADFVDLCCSAENTLGWY